jgi:cation diffusion facilitator family transporter
MNERLHAHDAVPAPTLPEQLIRRVTWIGIAVNLVLAVGKLLAGFYGESQAVIADGIEALLDLLTVVLVYAASRFWSRPPDETHPFGHGRIETLAAVLIGVSLVGAALGIGWQAVTTLREPHTAPPQWIAAAAAFASVVGKELLYRYTVLVGRRIKSVAVVATAWHYRSDAFSSIPVVIAVTGAILLPAWTVLDHVGAMLVSVFMLHAAFKITWPGLKELIDAGAPAEMQRRIRDLASAVPGVIQVHEIRTRYFGASLRVDLHVVVRGSITVRQGHAIALEVESRLIDRIEEVVDVIVHVEPPEEAVSEAPAPEAGKSSSVSAHSGRVP